MTILYLIRHPEVVRPKSPSLIFWRKEILRYRSEWHHWQVFCHPERSEGSPLLMFYFKRQKGERFFAVASEWRCWQFFFIQQPSEGSPLSHFLTLFPYDTIYNQKKQTRCYEIGNILYNTNVHIYFNAFIHINNDKIQRSN